MSQREVELYDRHDGDTVQCHVCSRDCVIPPGERGLCEVRKNVDGRLELETYGRAVSQAVDPIEKKPLFHFAPGSRVLSIATRGCNFRCDFCQNYRIALEHKDVREQELPPDAVARNAQARDCAGVAYTYTEPTIFFEYAYDTMAEVGPDGYNVFVSNGYMTEDGVDMLAPRLDAINVDIKGDRDFYREYCGVPDPEPIYRTLEQLADYDVWIEITNLLVTGRNTDEDVIRDRMAWIRDTLGADTPVHFSRFRPAYQMQDVPPTPIDELEAAMTIAEAEGLEYVYCGNVPGHESESTYCPDCGTLVIEREGYEIRRYELDDGGCPACGHDIPIGGNQWTVGTADSRLSRLGR